ncbi:MAG TPA: toprim domain-containing protein [Caproicibacter sp.]|nr:toprim domain-containing protein [Caproicibacter sp.]
MAAQTFHKQTDRLNEIKQTLQTVMDNYHQNPEKIAEMLAFKSQFYNYSINNTILIYSQNSFSTYVASFRDWNKKGYHVRKGQHGIKVLYPIRTELIVVGEENGKKKYKRVVDANPEEKDKIANGELKPVTLTRFGVGNVFDISQTDCPPEDYPKIFDMGYSSDQHAELYQAIKNYTEKKGIPVIETDLQSISLRGAFYPLENVIRISDKLNDTERLSTLTHELGHALMHNSKEAFKLPTGVKEFEADAISIMLQQYVGIDLTDSRKNHFVQNYNACIRLKDFSLDEVLKTINSTYYNLRNELEPALAPVVKLRQKQKDLSESQLAAIRCAVKRVQEIDRQTGDKFLEEYFSEQEKKGFPIPTDVHEKILDLYHNEIKKSLNPSLPVYIVGCFQKTDSINGHERTVDAVMLEYPDGSQKLSTGLLYSDPTEEYMSKWNSVDKINFTAMKEKLDKTVEDPTFDVPENRQLIHLLDEEIIKEKQVNMVPEPQKVENNNVTAENIHSKGKAKKPVPQQSKQDYKEQDAAVLNYIKHDVPLLTVASDMGFTPVKTGGYYSLKEHDSVRIYQDTNSFYRFSTGDGGSAIDFMMHFGGFSEKEAIQKLKDQYVGNRFDTIQPVEKHEQKPKPAPEKKEFVLPDKVNGKYSHSYAYLVKTRCLDPEIVQDCFKSGLIYEDNKHNAVFVGKDKDGIAAFATRHTSLTGSSFKRDVAGSRQDIGWMVNYKSDRLYICEAPIDALSIMSLRKRQGLPVNAASYLATCGTGKDAALYTRLRENPQIKEVILANDTDAAGKKANKKIAEKLSKEYPNIRVKLLSPHKGKDINDCLRNIVAPPKTREKGMEVER